LQNVSVSTFTLVFILLQEYPDRIFPDMSLFHGTFH
jgi:hypothetical protein